MRPVAGRFPTLPTPADFPDDGHAITLPVQRLLLRGLRHLAQRSAADLVGRPGDAAGGRLRRVAPAAAGAGDHSLSPEFADRKRTHALSAHVASHRHIEPGDTGSHTRLRGTCAAASREFASGRRTPTRFSSPDNSRSQRGSADGR